MLSAKLFAALAILQLALAPLKLSRGGLDVYSHGTYRVIPNSQLQIWMALVSAFFALIYFAAFRWLPRPLSNSLGLAHFVMVTAGLVLFWVTISTPISVIPPTPAQDITLLVAVFSIALGCVLLAVNCVWTVAVAFRSPKRPSPA